MKKILIVDDKAENLEAAKNYFSQVPGYEFLYAADRKTAEELLPECDALITDREMPYKLGDIAEEVYAAHRFPDSAFMANGYALLAQGVSREIPSLMVSQHGPQMLIITLNDKSYAKEVVESLKGGDPYSEDGLRKAFKTNLKVTHVGNNENIDKNDPIAWELAFNKFNEIFKLDERPIENEKPIESPKIKMQ